MKYEVTVGGETVEVEVDGGVVTVGGRRVEARLVAIPGGPLVRMSSDGTSRTFAMTRRGETWEVQRAGRVWQVQIADERARSLARLVGAGKRRVESGVVRAPMPGLVVRLEVVEGQQVSKGDGLLVLEAMKMENEIRAPASGPIQRILVKAGQAVEKGASLMEIGSGEQG